MISSPIFLWLPSGPVIDLCVPINIIKAQKYGWLPIAPDYALDMLAVLQDLVKVDGN